MNLFNKINKHKDNRNQKYIFNSMMNFAKEVLLESKNDNNTYKVHPLVDVIRLIGKKVQNKYLIELTNVDCFSRLESKNIYNIFFNSKNRNDQYIFNSIIKKDTVKEINLSKDLIITFPWKRERLIRTITYLGENRARLWRQDNNHSVQLILPIGLCLVSSGNHSIASGIIQGEGQIKTDRIYDISKIYEHVFCDGINYIRTKDNSIISSVDDVEMAAIFEIGRLMKDNSISY